MRCNRFIRLFAVRLAAHVSNGCKSLIRPSSGKDIAKTKGVRRETESEGRWRQISGLMNRNHRKERCHHRLLDDNLLDLILRKDILTKPISRSRETGGIDGMQVDELLPFLKENQETLIQEIREGKYKPNPVRRVEIPKETKGEYRKLGVPTVVDRVIQQAIAQELSFYRYKGKCRFRVHPKSVARMRNKIRELTDRNKGISSEVREKKYQEYVRGWVEYFRYADMKRLLRETDEWARRRIRAVYWKQWKKIRTRYQMLKALGLEEWKAKELACSRKGYWRMAQVLNQIFSNKIIAKLGYTSLLNYYLVVYEN